MLRYKYAVWECRKNLDQILSKNFMPLSNYLLCKFRLKNYAVFVPKPFINYTALSYKILENICAVF